MKKTWTVIGGLCDGQIKELDDSLVGGGQTYCVGGQRGRKNVCHMVQYDSTRGLSQTGFLVGYWLMRVCPPFRRTRC